MTKKEKKIVCVEKARSAGSIVSALRRGPATAAAARVMVVVEVRLNGSRGPYIFKFLIIH